MLIEKNTRCKISRLSQTEKQYAALCFRHVAGSGDPVQILLTTSPNSECWVIPKGSGDDNRKGHEIAQRGAWEEAGVVGRVGKRPFGYYTSKKRFAAEESVMIVAQVHLLHVLDLEEEFPQKGERVLRWFSPAAAASVVQEPDLKYLVRGLREGVMELFRLMPSVW